jgi:4-azaleucine resistance transporter AzlC
MIGFVPFALVFGAQASQKGLGAVEVPLMTGLNFAGGSEFAVIGLWTSPPHVVLLAAVTLLVNSRHLLMGAALAPHIRHLPRRKAFPALFFMCDESWAMGLADASRRASAGARDGFSLPYFLGAGSGMYLTWVVATAAGAALGPTFGNVESYGFYMAFPAVFLVMLKGMWKGFRAARPWLISLVVASVTHLLVPGAWYVAAGAVSGLVSAYAWAGR